VYQFGLLFGKFLNMIVAAMLITTQFGLKDKQQNGEQKYTKKKKED
jgi:hypothetical protein